MWHVNIKCQRWPSLTFEIPLILILKWNVRIRRILFSIKLEIKWSESTLCYALLTFSSYTMTKVNLNSLMSIFKYINTQHISFHFAYLMKYKHLNCIRWTWNMSMIWLTPFVCITNNRCWPTTQFHMVMFHITSMRTLKIPVSKFKIIVYMIQHYP